jgi:hypothetical protein
MSSISSKLNITDYVVLSQLKRKMKSYLLEIGCDNFKQSNFSKGLVVSLVLILEELLSDSIKHVIKNEINGLYKISPLVLNLAINENSKYNFMLKYVKSYNQTIKYHDSVFFNIKKVLDNLESSKHGSKLMVESETKNLLSYIILSIQYELVNLTVSMVKYAKKRTLSVLPLLYGIKCLVHEDISSKVELKLDSMDEKIIEVEVEEELEEDESDDKEIEVEQDSENSEDSEEEEQ